MIALLITATAAAAAPIGAVASISCSLASPDGKQFRVGGYFDGQGLHSNLSEIDASLPLTNVVLEPEQNQIIITSDGTMAHHWTVDAKDGQKIDVSLTQYGSRAALMTIEKRRFIGRHYARNIIGVGYCAVAPHQARGDLQ
jgi:hypothetical protein